MTNKCVYPGCDSTTTEFLLGVAYYNKREAEHIVGGVCVNHMRESIEDTMRQCVGTKLWVIILDQSKKLVYHSYDADQLGFKAAAGWEVKYLELLKR